MDIGIIGSGIGGLTAALMLSHRGIKVTLYERSSKLGGRLAYQEGSGYRVDQGPTIVLLPDMLLSLLEEGGIARSQIPLVACDPLYRIHYADGTQYTKYRDIDRQIEELDRVFPGESEGFTRFMKEMGAAFTQGKSNILERSFVRRRDFFNLSNLRSLAKLRVHQHVRTFVSDYFKSEKLRDAYSLQTLYIGGAPFRTPSLYALLPYAEHAFGIWYVQGGYAGLVSILEAELEKRGVVLRKHTEVRRLQINRGICSGLETEHGLHRHDAVVFNGDFPHLAGLLPKEAKPSRQRKFEPSSGCMLIYLGVNKRWEGALTHQFFLPASLTASLTEVFKQGRVPEDTSFYTFNPVALDPIAAPAGQSVLYLLVPVPPSGAINWAAEAPALADRVLAEAERRGYPGLREAIQWMSIRTPDEAQADGLYGGGSFGIAPTLTQSAVFRPQIAPYPIRGLYAVGASVHPGGGIPIVMQGAKLLTDHLSKEEKQWIPTAFSLNVKP